ncbi:MAG TPA: universal stress protein, partial [Burkholderiales bacterium]|nr:universal stress protein [Burkholderiales bacterium]
RTEAFGGLLSGSTVSSLIRRAAVPVLVVKDKARREYRRIVVATDFAEASVRVLESALRLFPDTHMTLFRAFETSGVGVPRNEQSIVQFRRLAEQDARGFLAACASAIDLGDARLDVVIEHGDVGQLLCDFVRARRVDLVVTGTHGRAAIMEALIGSDAKRLLNVVPCDLMTVRQRPR